MRRSSTRRGGTVDAPAGSLRLGARYTRAESRGIMRGGRVVLGAVLFLAGLVWFLQGIRVIPGSFMTGSTLWAIIGAILIIAGAATLVYAVRQGAPPHRAR